MVAGVFFRLGTGAMPFLFPLMLQLSFGLTPFQSGSITFATAIGSFGAKFVSEPILRWLGFRMSLMIATFISVLGVAAMGFYGPTTPLGIMLPLLVVTGFFQSVFWTATNAFTFADIDDKDAGQATGHQPGRHPAVAGLRRGARRRCPRRPAADACGEPVLLDFHIAFYVIAAVALVSTAMFYFLPKGAGQHLTSHGRATLEAAAE